MNIRSIFGFLPPRLLYSQEELPVKDVPLSGKAVVVIQKVGQEGPEPAVTCGEFVKTGGKLFDSRGRLLAFSPVTGTIDEIYDLRCIDREFTAISIAIAEADIWDENSGRIDGYETMDTGSLMATLRDAGYDLALPAGGKADAVILNCLESDLMISINAAVLAGRADSIRRGLKLLKGIASADAVIIAASPALRERAEAIAREGGERVAEVDMVKPVYPAGMNEILPRVLQRKGVRRPLVVSPVAVDSMVTYLEKGFPALDKIITLIDGNNQRVNMRVRLGTPISHVLREGNVRISDGDKLILGGTMRGITAFHAEFPVTADIDAIMIQSRRSVVSMGDTPCKGCGRCVSVCPNGLQPHLLGRYAEFFLFERCRDYDIDYCIECGMCAYVCPSRRALVQYIGLAKKELAKKEGEAAHAVE
ncbi:MAG: hypothetical protein JW807_12285 [Spirochaetes bacterium]|nr:hypothetical protein [Spirochaetota bacterium]